MIKLFRKYYSKLEKIIQVRYSSRNKAALRCLQSLGFNDRQIRHALLALNGVKPFTLINGHEISAPNLYNTLSGVRNNPLAKSLIADSLGLKASELWPEKKEAA